MGLKEINRRTFIKNTSLAAVALGVTNGLALARDKTLSPMKNALPRWKGFNLLDFFSPSPDINPSVKSTADDFQWMVDWGFDFVRLPLAYPRYVDFDRTKNINPADIYKIDEKVVEEIDKIVYMGMKYNLHVSINLHRAPGFCINAGFHEPYNLWQDKEAKEAFYYHWGMWAERYKNIAPGKISFDLLNEPCVREDMNDQHSKLGPVPGQLYREVAMNAAKAIRAANPNHLIIADGNDVGRSVIPEIEDLNIAQSCRGYYPHYISHYKAPWVFKDPDLSPTPVWPGTIEGKYYGKENIEEYYKPWAELVNRGVGVHCGECGCWKKTPHDIFLAWFEDVVNVLTKNNIGYALWNFRGEFGILDSDRADVAYEDWHGHKLDRKLLELLKKY